MKKKIKIFSILLVVIILISTILIITLNKKETELRINSAYLTIPGKYVTIVQNNVNRRTFPWIRFLKLPQKKLPYR